MQNRPKLSFYHCLLPLMLFRLPIACFFAALQLLHFLYGPNTWQLSLHSPFWLPPSRPTPCVPITLGSCLSHSSTAVITWRCHQFLQLLLCPWIECSCLICISVMWGWHIVGAQQMLIQLLNSWHLWGVCEDAEESWERCASFFQMSAPCPPGHLGSDRNRPSIWEPWLLSLCFNHFQFALGTSHHARNFDRIPGSLFFFLKKY